MLAGHFGKAHPADVALITGEEKIVPPNARFFICTTEAMPISREVDFVAIDEVQLAADPERGHVFTDRILHARGRHETLLLGATTMAAILKNLLDAPIESRPVFRIALERCPETLAPALAGRPLPPFPPTMFMPSPR